eukprot:3348446-Pyramimonas_sp.AAC.1
MLSPLRHAHSLKTFARVSRIEGGWFSKCGSRLSAAHIRCQTIARASRVEGGSFSNCGSRFSPARIRFKHLLELHGFP